MVISGKYGIQLQDYKKKKKIVVPKEDIDQFVSEVKKRSPVKSKAILWDIANEIEIRPRWKITPMIELLRKRGKLKFSKKRPRGWHVV